MRADWAPFARRHEYLRWPTGPMRDTENRKGVMHTTQGGDGVLTWYPVSGGIPHFTIMTTGEVVQHYACSRHSRALRNLRGGVETNTDGAIQVEIVGYAGKEHTPAQRTAITQLVRWLTAEGHVPPTTPMGRMSKPYRQATFAEWDNGEGWFAHGQIPEQDHTDPDMTDATWEAFLAGLGAEPPAGVDRPPVTWRVVGPTDVIRPGDSGLGVELWQRRFNRLLDLIDRRIDGDQARCVVTGVHDAESVQWVKAFQAWHNRHHGGSIAIDGIVGNLETRPALVAALAREGEPWAKAGGG